MGESTCTAFTLVGNMTAMLIRITYARSYQSPLRGNASHVNPGEFLASTSGHPVPGGWLQNDSHGVSPHMYARACAQHSSAV